MHIVTVSATNITLVVESHGNLTLTVAGANDQFTFTISDRRDQAVIYRSTSYKRKTTCLTAGRKKLRAAVRLIEEANGK